MYNHSFGFRAGIHCGKVIVGHIDTGNMVKIAATGDAVNMANRIQLANKELNTRLLISESAYKRIPGGGNADKVHHISMRGKAGTYAVYSMEI